MQHLFILVLFTVGLYCCPGYALLTSAIRITPDTPWVIPGAPSQTCDRLPSSISLTLKDISRDWYATFGRPPIISSTIPSSSLSAATELDFPPVLFFGRFDDLLPILTLLYNGNIASLLPLVTFFKENNNGYVGAHACKVLNPTLSPKFLPIVCSGLTDISVVYSMYMFSHSVLDIHPQHLWLQFENKPVSSNDYIELSSNFFNKKVSPAFQTRAFFLNDEDLMGGHRMDPLGEAVFSMDAWNEIFETVLRLGGNGVIVGTIPFPDERSITLAKLRGLTIAQHHFMILGTNTFRWPVGLPYSFSTNPEAQEFVLRSCVETLKEMDMIWTIGYRGLNDYAFWNDDPTFDTDAKRGELITKAMQTQYDILNNIVGSNSFPRVATYLWDELADLFDNNYLQFPPNTIRVFADNGAGMVRGNLTKLEAGDGVYYHVAMENGRANQLTEMIPPKRIYDQLRLFIEKNATGLVLINTSDIRPIPLSLAAIMDYVWDPSSVINASSTEIAQNEFITNWIAKAYSGASEATILAIKNLQVAYFNISYMANDTDATGEQQISSAIRVLNDAISSNLVAGTPFSSYALQVLSRAREVYSDHVFQTVTNLYNQAKTLYISKDIPEWRKDFFQSHVVTQFATHYYLLSSLLYICDVFDQLQNPEMNHNITALLNESVENMNALLVEQRKAEIGKWSNWYQNDLLDNHFSLRDNLLRSFLVAKNNLPSQRRLIFDGLPTRNFQFGTGVWSNEFWYNDLPRRNVQSNFPTLYKSKLSMDTAILIVCAAPSSNLICPFYPNQQRGDKINQGNATCSVNPTGITIYPHDTSKTSWNVSICASTQANLHVIIRYTLDGTNPTKSSPIFSGDTLNVPVTAAENVFITANTFDEYGNAIGVITRALLQIKME